MGIVPLLRRHAGVASLIAFRIVAYAAPVASCLAPALADEESSALAIFNRRIKPILEAKNPSSCSECHLSGVDLKDYIGDNQARTFAALRAAGLVDTDRPDESKLLAFIARRPEQPSLVLDKVRKEELAAFQAWIRAAVRDPELLDALAGDDPLGPQLPPEVIRHARRDRVLASFIDNIWSEVGRCAACHSPDRNQEQVQKHGERVSWIQRDGPEATLQYLADRGLIDAASPADSLLVAKPTLQVEHGGGQKMMVGDRSYRQFRRFIDDYAATAQGRYRTAADLPRPAKVVSVVSDIWLKIEGVPERFDKQLLRADVHRWISKGWSKRPVAGGDRAVAGDRRLWQQHLTLFAPRGSQAAAEFAREQRLPTGRYLVRIYIDQQGRLASDASYELGKDEFICQVEIAKTDWPVGYGAMTVIHWPE
jgi:hypothetical protein